MRLRKFVGLAASALAALIPVVSAQRASDPNFDTTIAKPAYANQGPRVLFDEAHHNIHTASGLYKPLADLLTADGYLVVPNTQKFTLQLLKGYRDPRNLERARRGGGVPSRGVEPVLHRGRVEPGFYRRGMRRGARLGAWGRCAAADC